MASLTQFIVNRVIVLKLDVSDLSLCQNLIFPYF